MKICKHFGQCGGCAFQDIPYKKQLADKKSKVKNLLSASGFKAKLKPINQAKPWFYRNKMEFSFADQDGLVLGLYTKKQKGRVVDLDECLIFSADAGKILKTIKGFLKEKSHSVYDKYSHKGFLRNLILREAKFTDQMMIGLVTSSQEELDKELFVKNLLNLKLKSKIKSIFWIVNDSLSDSVVFEQKNLLFGETFLTEKLGDLTFNIAIDSFFQVNPQILVRFYKKIKKAGRLSQDKKVLDLFCGIGSIGLSLACSAKFVWGVELSEPVVDMAWQNAKANNIDNVSFISSDVRKFLNGPQGIFHKGIDLLVVNPPRSGLSNKIKRAILRLGPEKIIYSSCKPESLFQDLEGLSPSYKPLFFEPFDFFPHTPHLECLTLLIKH